MSYSATQSMAQPASSSLVGWTRVIYALYAVSILTGLLGAATVVGAFLIGWPSIIAVILNYIKRGEAYGTWLDSHFRWQIRTFWYGLLWTVLCVAFVVFTLGIGLIVVWIPLAILTSWVVLGRSPPYHRSTADTSASTSSGERVRIIDSRSRSPMRPV